MPRTPLSRSWGDDRTVATALCRAWIAVPPAVASGSRAMRPRAHDGSRPGCRSREARRCARAREPNPDVGRPTRSRGGTARRGRADGNQGRHIPPRQPAHTRRRPSTAPRAPEEAMRHYMLSMQVAQRDNLNVQVQRPHWTRRRPGDEQRRHRGARGLGMAEVQIGELGGSAQSAWHIQGQDWVLEAEKRLGAGAAASKTGRPGCRARLPRHTRRRARTRPQPVEPWKLAFAWV
jgi:hypothetical protein